MEVGGKTGVCGSCQTHVWVLKAHKLQFVSAAPVACVVCYTSTCNLYQYDNEITEQSREWRGCRTISQPFRQVHFLQRVCDSAEASI